MSLGVRLLWVGTVAVIHKPCDPRQMIQLLFPYL